MTCTFNTLKKGVILLPVAALLGGCVSFNAEDARHDQIADYTNRLDAAAAQLLAQPLTLDDSLAIALTNSFEVRKADIDRELARLGRKTAFSAFLPQISAAANYYSYQKDPQTSSKQFDTEDINIGLPIFMPSTWFLYDAAKHGFAIGEISANYTRQSIVLKTTGAYCDILVQQDIIKAYEIQLDAARKNSERIKGLADEGLVTKWEGEQASYLFESREMQLRQAKRKLSVQKAEFLSLLGLSPVADFKLAPLPPRETTPDEPLDALVAYALEHHPLLSMADRQVVMKENSVREAFCSFIPTLAGFGKESFSGNELMTVSPNFVMGLNAAWDIFNGISIAKYKASKVELEKTKLERENSFLSVMTGVISAQASLSDVSEAAAIAKRAFSVASAKYEDYDAKSREGLIPVGDALDALAERDLAEVELLKLSYAERTARTALEFAMGRIAVPPPDEAK